MKIMVFWDVTQCSFVTELRDVIPEEHNYEVNLPNNEII
jgi:hypothetical protein